MRCLAHLTRAILLLPMAGISKFTARQSVVAIAPPPAPSALWTPPIASEPARWKPAVGALDDIRADAPKKQRAKAKPRNFTPTTKVQHSAVITPSAPPKQKATLWSPTRVQRAERRGAIKRLVWLDTEGLLERLARGLPGIAEGDHVDKSIRDLQRHTPLIKWHMSHNVGLPADGVINAPQKRRPSRPSRATRGANRGGSRAAPRGGTRGGAGSRKHRKPGGSNGRKKANTPKGRSPPTAATIDNTVEDSKGTELKEALMHVSPVFFSLVKEAASREPSSAARLYRKVAGAGASLASWNTGRILSFSRERQYKQMNVFLGQIVRIVAECRGILGCDGDDGCVLQAVEQHQKEMEREVRRVGPEVGLRRAAPPRPRKPARGPVQSNVRAAVNRYRKKP